VIGRENCLRSNSISGTPTTPLSAIPIALNEISRRAASAQMTSPSENARNVGNLLPAVLSRQFPPKEQVVNFDQSFSLFLSILTTAKS
jgi:hypothetical protein